MWVGVSVIVRRYRASCASCRVYDRGGKGSVNWLFNYRSGKADLPTNKQTIIDKSRKAYTGLGLTNLCLTRVVSERRFFKLHQNKKLIV